MLDLKTDKFSAYLAGPMFGYPEFNWPAFTDAKEIIEARSRQRITVHSASEVAPFAHTGECPPGRGGQSGHTDACNLRADLLQMLWCDAVILLPNWHQSWGARTEFTVASLSGMESLLYVDGSLLTLTGQPFPYEAA